MSLKKFLTNLIQKFSPVDISLGRYTHKELLEMKKGGYDSEELRKYLDLYDQGKHPKQIKSIERKERNRLKQQLRKLRFEDISGLDLTESEIPNPTDLSKIQQYLSVPINPESKIIKESYEGLKADYASLVKGQIALTSIVQSAPQFWDKDGRIGYAAFVLTYVKQGIYANNPKFLKLICSMLNNFKQEKTCPEGLSAEMKKLYNDLDNPQSEFHVNIDQSLLDNYNLHFEDKKVVSEDIIVATSSKTQSEKDKLPNKSFPSDGILPLICATGKKDYNYFNFIKGEYYSA